MLITPKFQTRSLEATFVFTPFPVEKYKEVRTLIEHLTIPTMFGALGASNAFQLMGELPRDKQKLLDTLDKIIANVSEEELRHYRKNLKHL